MGRYSEESKQRVRERSDLVELAGQYTELRRTGADTWTGRCPLHDERTPSFTITPSKQLFKCFGCDAGGDVITLVQAKEGLDFPGALQFLARRAGVELEREDDDPQSARRRERRARQLELLTRASTFYARHLLSPQSSDAAAAAAYLAQRGLRQDILRRFGVGFAPGDGGAMIRAATAAGYSTQELTDAGLVVQRRGRDDRLDRFRARLMFPVCDLQGRVVGFGARKLAGARGAKYVNSPSSAIYRKSELLYGAHHARAAAAKAGAMIVVEGYTDAVALHQAGIENTVAVMGTAVTEAHVKTLKRLARTVVLVLDGDDSGALAILRAGSLARSCGLEVLVASLPVGTDPAELVHRDGRDAIGALISDARAFARFHVQYHVERSDVSSAEGKDRLVSDLRAVFADIPSSAVREELIALVASHLQLQPALVSSWMPSPAGPAGTSSPPLQSTIPSLASGASADSTRELLLRCVIDPAAAGELPDGPELDAMFGDALERRAARHIAAHPTNPASELPADDHALIAFITSLLAAASSRP